MFNRYGIVRVDCLQFLPGLVILFVKSFNSQRVSQGHLFQNKIRLTYDRYIHVSQLLVFERGLRPFFSFLWHSFSNHASHVLMNKRHRAMGRSRSLDHDNYSAQLSEPNAAPHLIIGTFQPISSCLGVQRVPSKHVMRHCIGKDPAWASKVRTDTRNCPQRNNVCALGN